MQEYGEGLGNYDFSDDQKASVPQAIIRVELAAPPMEIEALTRSVSFMHSLWDTHRDRYDRLALESSRQLAMQGDTSC